MEGGFEGLGEGVGPSLTQCRCKCNCETGPETCDCLCDCPAQQEEQFDIFSLVLNLVTPLLGGNGSEAVSQALGLVWGFIASLLGGLRVLQEEQGVDEAIRSMTKMVIYILNKLTGQLQRRINLV